MNILKPIFIACLVILLGWGLYNLVHEKKALQVELGKLSETTSALEKENTSLRASIEYYKKPENLLKASRSQFNFKQAGEQMMIIVPAASSSSSSAEKNP